MNPEEKTSYNAQYQEAFRKYVGNEYCTKHQWGSVFTLENVQH
jgi:hypothetical protein